MAMKKGEEKNLMKGSYEWFWFSRPGMTTSDANVLEH